jgi:RNA polymerase sigma-70 factor (ECF subfamily)
MLVDFHSLFERYSQDVFRFTLYLSADPSLAEELTQETFVRAWVTSGGLRGGTVKAYLLAIARNLFLAERKRKRTERRVALDSNVIDPKPGPQAVAEGRIELDTALEALQGLPEIDRSALLMHVQDGLPYAAIASALGLSTAAIKVRVHRARIKLRQLCNPMEVEP